MAKKISQLTARVMMPLVRNLLESHVEQEIKKLLEQPAFRKEIEKMVSSSLTGAIKELVEDQQEAGLSGASVR